jgi:hypothetical protein
MQHARGDARDVAGLRGLKAEEADHEGSATPSSAGLGDALAVAGLKPLRSNSKT